VYYSTKKFQEPICNYASITIFASQWLTANSQQQYTWSELFNKNLKKNKI